MTDYGYAHYYGQKVILVDRVTGESSRAFDKNDAVLLVTTGSTPNPSFLVHDLLSRSHAYDAEREGRWNNWADYKTERRRNAALRGQITKLKKRLAEKEGSTA